MPTRRDMELIIVVSMLFWPARSVVKLWGRKQLATAAPGSLGHLAGEIITTIV